MPKYPLKQTSLPTNSEFFPMHQLTPGLYAFQRAVARPFRQPFELQAILAFVDDLLFKEKLHVLKSVVFLSNRTIMTASPKKRT